jgi:hypothetical protein
LPLKKTRLKSITSGNVKEGISSNGEEHNGIGGAAYARTIQAKGNGHQAKGNGCQAKENGSQACRAAE